MDEDNVNEDFFDDEELRVEERNTREFRNMHAVHVELRWRSDPFLLPNIRFRQLFHLTKRIVRYLLDELTPTMPISRRMDAITPQMRIFVALSFYATGSYQRSVAQHYLHPMSQQSVSRAIHEVTNRIYNGIAHRWIRFPRTLAEKEDLARVFCDRTGIPGIIGAIDCTRIDMLAPQIDEHNYVDRRGNHSKNVQIVCDYSTRILSINSRYAGSTHDSTIWRNSSVKRIMEESYQRGETYHLLGDSGYPLQPWLLTPILHTANGSPEERYTDAHCSGRSCIERCNGLLKGRFRCLLGERRLRYSPDFVGKLVVVCAVLHNILIARNAGYANEDEADFPEQFFVPYTDAAANEEGKRVRNNILLRQFSINVNANRIDEWSNSSSGLSLHSVGLTMIIDTPPVLSVCAKESDT